MMYRQDVGIKPRDIARFKQKYLINPDTDCWEWQAYLDKDGYSNFRFADKIWFGHRFSLFLSQGYLTEGLVVDHTCDNPTCVNPEHLEEVTQKENVSRALDRKYLSMSEEEYELFQES